MVVRTLVALVALLCSGVLSGCAYYVQTGFQRVAITSEPHGAFVRVDGIPKGRTPLSAKLPRGEDHYVVFEYPGMVNQGVLIESRYSGTGMTYFFLGLMMFGPFEFVDFANGSVFKLDREHVHRRMFPDEYAGREPVPAEAASQVEARETSRVEIITLSPEPIASDWGTLQP